MDPFIPKGAVYVLYLARHNIASHELVDVKNQQAQYADPLLFQRWASVADGFCSVGVLVRETIIIFKAKPNSTGTHS